MISIHDASDKTPERMARDWRTAACGDVHALGWLMLAYTWSPIVWTDGRRLQANFLHADFLALDFDSPEFPLAHARRAFAGLTHVIGTTRNHQREKNGVVCDRFRVAIPFAQRITECELYKHNVLLAFAMFEHCDEACKDGARPFFACREIVEIEDDGEPWDVDPLPVASPRKRLARRPSRGYLPATTRRWLADPIPLGTINNTMFKLGSALRRAGFSLDDALDAVRATPTMTGLDAYDQNLCLTTAANGYERQCQDEKKETPRGSAALE